MSDFNALSELIPLGHFFEQRSFYKGLLEVQMNLGYLLIANGKSCVFLPPNLRESPTYGVVAVVSESGASCDEACTYSRMRCDPDRFSDVADRKSSNDRHS